MTYSRIGYYESIDSYIKCKNYINDNYWFYVSCDKYGKEYGEIYRADCNFRKINWKGII